MDKKKKKRDEKKLADRRKSADKVKEGMQESCEINLNLKRVLQDTGLFFYLIRMMRLF